MTAAHSATALVAGALATYRLTRLVTEDELTAPLRDRIWETHPPESSRLGYLISCPHCTSIYAGAAVSALAFVASTAISRRHHGQVPSMLLIGTLALSGATSLYHEYRDSPPR
jgi:hypothetical protein